MKYAYGITMLLSVALPGMGLAQTIEIDNMVIVADNEYQPALAAAAEQKKEAAGEVLPQSKNSTDQGWFSRLQGGYVHPYLTLTGEYTDNLYNVGDETTSNFLTTISPGIWFALPRTKTIPITITPHNTSAGGLRGSLATYQGYERIQAYLLGGLDIKNYSEDSDLNKTDGKLEAFLRYNLRGGLSFQVVDRYSQSQDSFGNGDATADNLRRYDSNLAMATVDWRFTPKLRGVLDLSNFYLDYKDDRNNEYDRSDNGASFTAYYRYSPKTSFFLGYKYVDVAYDTAVERDNTQNFVHGGISWTPSEKTTLSARLGYQKRSYEDDSSDSADTNELTTGIQLDYKISEKTAIAFSVTRQVEEADTAGALGETVLSSNVRYRQRFTNRISGSIGFGYENTEYDSLTPPNREDKRYSFRPALQYRFSNWLMFELAYRYEKRDSTDVLYEYDSHSILFSLRSSL